MRRIFLLLLLTPLGLQAQVADTMRNAIGLLGEWQSVLGANNSTRMNTVGLMYKHLSKKEHLIYTVSLGISTFHDEPYTNIKYVNGNTSSMYWHRTIVNMPVVGLGVEWQRQFYKKVYFFAGLEWKAGSGSGGSDTLEQWETRMPPPDPSGANKYWTKTTDYSYPGERVNMLVAGAAPHIGAKLEFKRFTIGTMYLNYLWFTSIHTKTGGSIASIDLDVTNIYHRFYVAYKF